MHPDDDVDGEVAAVRRHRVVAAAVETPKPISSGKRSSCLQACVVTDTCPAYQFVESLAVVVPSLRR
jgi:hypothetical protein